MADDEGKALLTEWIEMMGLLREASYSRDVSDKEFRRLARSVLPSKPKRPAVSKKTP
jgi:hypothetical protein